jgi:hypothetical protein
MSYALINIFLIIHKNIGYSVFCAQLIFMPKDVFAGTDSVWGRMDSGWDEGHAEGVSDVQAGRPSDNTCPREFIGNIAYCTAWKTGYWDGYRAGETIGEAESSK